MQNKDKRKNQPTSVNIDQELYKQVKIAAINDGITLTEFIEAALRWKIGYSEDNRGRMELQREKLKASET